MKNLFLSLLFISISVYPNDLPELGSHFDNLINLSDEKKIKFEILSKVYQSNSLITDLEINDYIEKLGRELSVKGTKEKLDIKFFILNDSSINAFAMLGGIIGIHSGLILAANSESELASVISHEIAHITQKHLLRLFDSQARNSYKSYIAIAIAILAARSNPQVASGAIAAANASSIQNTLDFTRENEKEADRVGLEILLKSGYDPKGFVDFFQTIDKFNEFSSGAAPAFLRTHPITGERISDIQDRLKEYRFIQKSSDIDFYLVKAKLKVFLGDKEYITNYFMKEIKEKKSLNENASYFGLVHAYLRNNKIDEARKNFDILKYKNIKSPMLFQLESKLLISEKNYLGAYKILNIGLKEFPTNKSLIYEFVNLLINLNKSQQAISFLKKYENLYSTKSFLYELYAKAYAANGQILLQHENLSSYFYYRYDLDEAIIQMDLANKSGEGNFYEKSRVEFRLNELKREADLLIN